MTIDKLLRAQIALILFAAAYLAEVVRGGLQAIPKRQYEMADALGAYLLAENALRGAAAGAAHRGAAAREHLHRLRSRTPRWSLIIGLFDLLATIKVVAHRPGLGRLRLEAYLFAAAVYFVFCFAMSLYSRRLETNR